MLEEQFHTVLVHVQSLETKCLPEFFGRHYCNEMKSVHCANFTKYRSNQLSILKIKTILGEGMYLCFPPKIPPNFLFVEKCVNSIKTLKGPSCRKLYCASKRVWMVVITRQKIV